MSYQKKFTLLQNSVYPLSFDTSYKVYGKNVRLNGVALKLNNFADIHVGATHFIFASFNS